MFHCVDMCYEKHLKFWFELSHTHGSTKHLKDFSMFFQKIPILKIYAPKKGAMFLCMYLYILWVYNVCIYTYCGYITYAYIHMLSCDL